MTGSEKEKVPTAWCSLLQSSNETSCKQLPSENGEEAIKYGSGVHQEFPYSIRLCHYSP